jgi:hypothetical protein
MGAWEQQPEPEPTYGLWDRVPVLQLTRALDAVSLAAAHAKTSVAHHKLRAADRDHLAAASVVRQRLHA